MKAGVSGHRDLTEKRTVAWVRSRIEDAIDTLHITSGFTSLAIGADQLFATALKSRRIPFTAVIPCHDYETTFDDVELATYKALVSSATDMVQLPFTEPAEAAYMAAGRTIVDYSDVIVAVWNGRPARGYGGTADIVQYALERQKMIWYINPETREVMKFTGRDKHVERQR